MKQVFAISLVLLFGSVSLFGIISTLGNDGQHGGMSTCPLMGDIASVCPMGGVGHIAAWQSVFTASAVRTVSALLLIMLTLAMAAWAFGLFAHTPSASAFLAGSIRGTGIAPSHLLTAFSRGILHPRLYA